MAPHLNRLEETGSDEGSQHTFLCIIYNNVNFMYYILLINTLIYYYIIVFLDHYALFSFCAAIDHENSVRGEAHFWNALSLIILLKNYKYGNF